MLAIAENMEESEMNESTLRPYQHRALTNLYRLATDIHGLRRLLHQLTEHTLKGMDVEILPKFGGTWFMTSMRGGWWLTGSRTFYMAKRR